MSKVVVTGASGFIGSHLAARLVEQGHDVGVVVRRAEQAAHFGSRNVRAHIADVSDKRSLELAVRGADIVYHLAGRIRAASLTDFRLVNVTGVENVAAASAESNSPPVLVLVSSLAAAGPSPAGRPRDESDPPTPISQYGTSKLEGEQAAYRWAGKVPTSIVRPPFVFGGGDRSSLPLFRMIRRWGMQVIPWGHDFSLSLIHVDDFIQALVAVAYRGRRIAESCKSLQCKFEKSRSDDSVGIYSPADPTVVTYSQMGQMIAATSHCRVRVRRIPRPLLWTVCAANAAFSRATGRLGILNFDKLREATAGDWTCSNERCRSELGFLPSAPLAERLSQTWNWYDRAGWL